MHPLLRYLERLHEVHQTGLDTPELSFRAALENLFNTIGEDLEPPVHANAELADAGSGRPDFGLFEIRSGNLRGVVEVKALDKDTLSAADGEQVTGYWRQYGCVLVTNYRDFLLVVRQPDGKPRVEGRYELAHDADAFWKANPRTLAKEHADAFTDFVIGVMTRAAAIGRPKDLAGDLARHAREAKRRLEQHDIGALAPLQTAFEESLGLHFSGDEGVNFFRSSLVQTLFYGLFSGWMLWRQGRHKPGTFDWKDASEYLPLPLIGDLYEEIARPKRLADLGLREPLEWATTSLNRVDEEQFFKRFDSDHAITLFYEPFLEAFDPNLRKELGVWYTPPEIVQYMVGRVDQLLRTELNVADGLADDQVYVLDPACGTGSYVIEVAKLMHRTLLEQGHGALAASRVKKALCSRVFGFEILPAPYVVAHLQLGIFLRSLGTKLTPKERCEVYLTNALTGWEPPKEPKTELLFPELRKEAERASRVKREAPILVILGNPPYNGFVGVAQDEEADLIAPYKDGLRKKWGVAKQVLDDLYVRFFRLAERQIGDVGARGIVSFISNYSWLDGRSHPIMRERLLARFDRIWIDNCNGDKYRTGKRTPDGRPDQSVFHVDARDIGIQVGTAITTLARIRKTRPGEEAAHILYRELWGTAAEKRRTLLRSVAEPESSVDYEYLATSETQRFAIFRGSKASAYDVWPVVPSILPESVPGVLTRRDEFVIDIDRENLLKRLKDYFDPSLSDVEIADRYPRVMEDGAGFLAAEARRRLVRKGFLPEKVVPIYYRPFDVRWVYCDGTAGLVSRPSPEFAVHAGVMTTALELRQKLPTLNWDRGLVVSCLADHLGNGTSVYFPARIAKPALLGKAWEANINLALLKELCGIAGVDPVGSDGHSQTEAAEFIASELFYHVVAILWSPAYRKDNADALRQDWPRIPIPANRDLLESSAGLGRIVAAHLLPDKPVSGVTTGKLRAELRTLAIPSKVGDATIDPTTDLKVEAGWGYRGQKNAVMCGQGKAVPRLSANASDEHAFDVYINDSVYWANIPADVWAMTIGGYPVIKKWLSYREYKVLGRPLREDEATYITEVVRRLKALLLLRDELDANYRASAQDALDWNAKKQAASDEAAAGYGAGRRSGSKKRPGAPA